ncbi:MAG: fimbrillin family protein [Prevotella sp.]|nr:fimbrillin family protein [Prevotella sp.]
MNDKLKYIFLTFLVCVLCLTSCSSDSDSQAPDAGPLAELKFDLQGISRASVTNNDNFKLQSFKVFGDMKSSSSPGNIVVFNGDEVKYNSSTNGWEYSNTQYWFPNYEYSFVAVHPATLLSTPQYSDSRLSFTYTLPSDNNNATDILIATHRRECGNYQQGTTEPVRFKFSHILSLINIALSLDDNLMGKDEFFQFRKLEFSGVKTKAQYDILPAPRLSNSQTDDMVVNESSQEEGNLTIGLETPVKVENNGTGVSFFDDDAALIMLPQTFAATSNAQLVLTYTVNGDTTEKQVAIPLRGITWEPGKSYIYKFIIDKSGLKLDKCEINPWNVIRGEIAVD